MQYEHDLKKMPLFQSDHLTRLGQQIFQAMGASKEAAQRVSESLVLANLAGIDSHGVVRIPQYVRDIDIGRLHPKAEAKKVVDAGWAVILDGQGGFGQIIAEQGIDIALSMAKSKGIGVVGIRHARHIGRLGEYVLKAAKSGMIGLGFCNGCTPNVAPFGAMERVLGTNPIACAAPVREGNPILIDLATSFATEGKARVARNSGQPLEQGMVIDRFGEPSVDANDFYSGGALLPIGQHKGSALGLMVELLGGFLTGAGCAAFPEHDDSNGVLFIVLDPNPLCGLEAFTNDIERIRCAVRSAKKAKGFEEILLPGDPEFRSEIFRREKGIPLDEKTWEELSELAKRLGIAEPIPIGGIL